MRFRPCIDIHHGRVKQIVGGSLRDAAGGLGKAEADLKENFVSDREASFYAALYRDMALAGGHVIMLDHRDSEYYEATRKQALEALRRYPGGLMAGGGIDPEKIEILRKQLLEHDNSAESIGLRNLSRRLYLRYGPGSGVSVRNTEDPGTEVTVTVNTAGSGIRFQETSSYTQEGKEGVNV